MIKNISNAGANWVIIDTSRSPHNVSSGTLYTNLANVEQGYNPLDILSNGFKIRDTGLDWNQSAYSHIYVAFAEAPFKYSLAR
jgi:hypothetical protein